MKINNKAPQSLVNDRTIADLKDPGLRKAKNDGVKTKELMDSTKLNLSPQARQISKATAIAKDSSVDEAKIARLQKMVDAGEYKVSAEDVAEKLLTEHLTLGE